MTEESGGGQDQGEQKNGTKKCQVEFQIEAPPEPLPLACTLSSSSSSSSLTHTELPMLPGWCVRSSSLPLSIASPAPRAWPSHQHPLLTSVPFFPFSKHHASLSPTSSSSTAHPAIRLTKTPHGCLRVRAARPHPSPVHLIPSEQVVGACACTCADTWATKMTVNLSGEGCRGTRRGLLAATPLHLGSRQTVQPQGWDDERSTENELPWILIIS